MSLISYANDILNISRTQHEMKRFFSALKVAYACAGHTFIT